MHSNISLSTWNIHGLSHNTLGDKIMNKDFPNNISKIDFIFLIETWSNADIDLPCFKAFVSNTTIPRTDLNIFNAKTKDSRVCPKSKMLI
jgi:hypothetical protein